MGAASPAQTPGCIFQGARLTLGRTRRMERLASALYTKCGPRVPRGRHSEMDINECTHTHTSVHAHTYTYHPGTCRQGMGANYLSLKEPQRPLPDRGHRGICTNSCEWRTRRTGRCRRGGGKGGAGQAAGPSLCEAQALDPGTVARVPAADGVLIVLGCSLALDLSKLTR